LKQFIIPKPRLYLEYLHPRKPDSTGPSMCNQSPAKRIYQITRFDPLKNLGPFMLDLSSKPLIFLGIHFKIPLGTRIL